MTRRALLIAVAGLLPGLAAVGAAAQGDEKPSLLTVGSANLFLIRGGDTLNGRPEAVKDRIDRVHDVFAKYLGGPYRHFTTKRWGDRVHIYLNGEFVLAVTPADARNTRYKTAAQLAPNWVRLLEKGFDAAHVRTSGN
jgi:hypothetical protein